MIQLYVSITLYGWMVGLDDVRELLTRWSGFWVWVEGGLWCLCSVGREGGLGRWPGGDWCCSFC